MLSIFFGHKGLFGGSHSRDNLEDIAIMDNPDYFIVCYTMIDKKGKYWYRESRIMKHSITGFTIQSDKPLRQEVKQIG